MKNDRQGVRINSTNITYRITLKLYRARRSKTRRSSYIL
jgi:hypothetical protein